MGVERFSLKISAQLEKVARMEPDFEDTEFPYWLKFKCTAEGCRLEHSKWIPLFVGSKVALQCNDCSRRGTLGLASGCFGVPYVGGESTLAVVECCGFEPIAYQFDMGWKIVGVTFNPPAMCFIAIYSSQNMQCILMKFKM
ncbi:uncharacterized protein LOC127903726 isoform X3 [Citrus sinensis]|uniref:uncharacterized protein LOC127903726 isoform X3 n=1 Tax=Citrus sinensis TaxID=2711 RepID=UPI002277BA10|nr:uncharacterized protein LOC127903726 isoform X3 [Citrus sinensis]